jgi:hypothetical protein
MMSFLPSKINCDQNRRSFYQHCLPRHADCGILRSKISGDRRFAERDEPFQLSDVPLSGDNIPDRRLVLAGHDSDLWFIKYTHGGFLPYGVLVLFFGGKG